MNKIFISHSIKDINYVKSFVEKILMLGLEIPESRIFCSSIEGQGISSGDYIPDKLKEEINNASLALLFISKNYKESEICLNELGAAWVKLPKNKVIPILLPNINFNELGILHINTIGLKIDNQYDIMKLIDDCKNEINPNYKIQKVNKKIEEFISEIKRFKQNVFKIQNSINEEIKECFDNNLFVFDSIIRKSIPAFSDGIHKIIDLKLQDSIFLELSKAKFLKKMWFKYAEGDNYVEKLNQLKNGNWIMTNRNWELKISEMWVGMFVENQYEFILIQTSEMTPYKIDSDVGSESFVVGVLNDGRFISENERINGYAIFNNEKIDLDNYGVEQRQRMPDTHWIFFATHYNKVGCNAHQTIDFCNKLDKGEIQVNANNIIEFLKSLRNHPIVQKHR